MLVERPLLCLQTLTNRPHVLACAYCFAFVGNEVTSLGVLNKTLSRQGIVEGLQAGDTVVSVGHGLVSCQGFCGEVYCSPDCMSAHWSNGHSLLCTGTIAEDDALTSPLIHFKSHAVATNEIFLLVAELFARVCACADRGGAVEELLRPLEEYVRQQWWEAAVAPVDVDPVGFRRDLAGLVQDSWALLERTLRLEERGLHQILSAEYMSR